MLLLFGSHCNLILDGEYRNYIALCLPLRIAHDLGSDSLEDHAFLFVPQAAF